MIRSDNIGQITAALAEAIKAFEPIKKDREVRTGKYTFHYATLDSILSAVRPALCANGLVLSQSTGNDGGVEFLETVLLHISGEWLSTRTAVIVQDRGPQAYGSGLTYAARYGISRLLCVCADDDDDGAAAAGIPAEIEKITPPTINKSQVDVIRNECAELGVDLVQFCKFMGVMNISELKASRYQDAINALAKKRAATASAVTAE